ncbi:MAG: hypothetical protein NTX17_06635 [Candidatus Eisenbacteria bacterium]|nr:hypothetical protein [Candidatus Eisenbacteria bacterium]
MRNQRVFVLVLLAATAAVLTLAAGAYASSNMLMYGKEKLVGKSAGAFFLTSGTYTGRIDGDIWLDGKEFSITRSTTIYIIGEGLRQTGTPVSNVSILLSGFEENGISRVKMVVVRPDDSVLREDYRKAAIPEKAIPSGVNPNTGTLAAETPR